MCLVSELSRLAEELTGTRPTLPKASSVLAPGSQSNSRNPAGSLGLWESAAHGYVGCGDTGRDISPQRAPDGPWTDI